MKRDLHSLKRDCEVRFFWSLKVGPCTYINVKKKWARDFFWVCFHHFHLFHGSVIDTRGLVNDTADWLTISRNSNCQQRIRTTTPRIRNCHRCSVNATSNSVKDTFGPFMPVILCQQKTAFLKKTQLPNNCHLVPETVIESQ